MTKRKFKKLYNEIIIKNSDMDAGLYGVKWILIEHVYNIHIRYIKTTKALQIGDNGSILHTIIYRNNDIKEHIVYVPNIIIKHRKLILQNTLKN